MDPHLISVNRPFKDCIPLQAKQKYIRQKINYKYVYFCRAKVARGQVPQPKKLKSSLRVMAIDPRQRTIYNNQQQAQAPDFTQQIMPRSDFTQRYDNCYPQSYKLLDLIKD